MRQMTKLCWGFFIAFVMAFVSLKAELIKREFNYQVDDNSFKGYLVYDGSSLEKRPGIILVHEFWGHNDYVRNRAEMLAQLGYVAFALDMYGEGKNATHPRQASAFSRKVKKDMKSAQMRFVKAMDLLKQASFTDPNKLAAIGYCFGGGIVLEMARLGLNLKGVVSFHGSLATDTPAVKGQSQTKILVCNGEKDPFVSKEAIQNFRQEMAVAEMDYRLINYKNAMHAFTNPGADELGRKFNMPLKYNSQADKNSWRDMQVFLKKIFRN